MNVPSLACLYRTLVILSTGNAEVFETWVWLHLPAMTLNAIYGAQDLFTFSSTISWRAVYGFSTRHSYVFFDSSVWLAMATFIVVAFSARFWFIRSYETR